ncbi:ABC-type (unclassified) transport system, ATPase component [Thiovulum sp. ES]|nr:ABC-type (unclassified) transport system, ATPase component [Thiovulum sp. ES]
MAKLVASKLQKIIKNKIIVRDISLEVNSGEVVGLLGPNGAGKTTTFYMISGLLPQDSGKVLLNGTDISKAPIHKRAKYGIGYLPQESSIFKDLTVEENILLASEVTISSKTKRRRKLEELLQLFNIEPIRHNLGGSLSGGERRRVEIARALVNSPQFLLLDEPFAGVDPIAVFDIRQVIKQLKEMNIGILITDHNVRETLQTCDTAFVIKSGSLLASGSSDEIAENELVRTHYLGEDFKF